MLLEKAAKIDAERPAEPGAFIVKKELHREVSSSSASAGSAVSSPSKKEHLRELSSTSAGTESDLEVDAAVPSTM